jgi:hypothetical protein
MNTPTKPWPTVQLEHQVISESPRKVIYRFSDEPEKIYTTMEHAMRVRSLPQEVPPLSLYDKYQLWSEQKLRPQPDMANEIAIKNKTIDALRLQIRELERILTEMEQAMRVRSLPQEAPPLSEHDTANEIAIKDKAIEELRLQIRELKENNIRLNNQKDRSAPQEVPPLSEHHMEDEIEDKDRYISSLKRVIWELTENKLKSADAQKGILQYSLFTKAVAKALGLPTFEINLMDLTNRIENLVRWKEDALKVLGEWDRVLAYLSKSPDVNMGDTLSEKCLEFLRERDAIIRAHILERAQFRTHFEKPVSK